MQRKSYSIDIGKDEIESIIGVTDRIAPTEIGLLEGTVYSESIRPQPLIVSAALVARCDYEEVKGQIVGFMPCLSLRLFSYQPKPIMINSNMLVRAQREFRKNPVFQAYEFQLIAPPAVMSDLVQMFSYLPPFSRRLEYQYKK